MIKNHPKLATIPVPLQYPDPRSQYRLHLTLPTKQIKKQTLQTNPKSVKWSHQTHHTHTHKNSMNNPIPNNKITKTHIHLTSHKTHTIRLQQNNKNPSTKTPNKTNKKKCYKVQTTSRSKLDKLNKNKRGRGIGRGTSCTIWTCCHEWKQRQRSSGNLSKKQKKRDTQRDKTESSIYLI